MTTENSVQNAIQNYFEALSSGDNTSLKACFTDDAVWLAPGDLPNSGRWVGPDAIADEFFPIANAHIQPGTFATNPVSMTIGESNVIVEWEGSAKTISGNAYYNRYMANFIIRGGKIAEVREYFDTQRGATLFA